MTTLPAPTDPRSLSPNELGDDYRCLTSRYALRIAVRSRAVFGDYEIDPLFGRLLGAGPRADGIPPAMSAATRRASGGI